MWILLHNMFDWYKDLMDNRSDPRVKDWPMMSTPVYTLALCILYAYFSKSLGPQLMRHRKAFDLRQLLIYYNLFQTLFSAWIFYEYLMSGWWGHYNFACQPVDYSNNPLALRMAKTCWWYYISKFTEFFDTLFFILRKKNEHVSTLHVIHHGCMPFSVWMGMKFAPGGHSTFFALLNTFVHIVMYFYYMIAAMGPKYQKYIWWKKYLTTFQMIQFVAIFTHQFQLLFRECDYPKSFMIWIGLHGVLFLFLFSDFYKTKYTRNSMKISYNTNGYVKMANGGTSTYYTNGNVNKIMQNGTRTNKTSITNGTYSTGNKGACMPILDDEYEITTTDNCQTTMDNGSNISNYNSNNNNNNKCISHSQNGGIYSNGNYAATSNAIIMNKGHDDDHLQHHYTKYTQQHYDHDHEQHELKEGALSNNEAILNSDTSTSNLHQRKVK